MRRKRVMWEYETGGFGFACPIDGCQMTMTSLTLGDALSNARLHTIRTHDEEVLACGGCGQSFPSHVFGVCPQPTEPDENQVRNR